MDGFGFNTSLPNGESNYNKSIIYPDVNVGALWTHAPKEAFRYYLGFSMDHLSRPRESFLDDGDNRLNYRFNAHGGMEIFLNRENTLSLSPSVLYMLQGNAQEFNFGLALNYWLTDDLAIFGGGWYRLEDAAILNAGVELYNVRVGLSYDVNHSDLRTATRAQGALEASVVYIFKKEKPGKVQYENYCPTF